MLVPTLDSLANTKLVKEINIYKFKINLEFSKMFTIFDTEYMNNEKWQFYV